MESSFTGAHVGTAQWRALIAAEGVAAVFAVLSLHTIWDRLQGAGGGTRALESLTSTPLVVGGPILRDLVLFLVAIVALHAAVGLAGFGLSLGTKRALRSAGTVPAAVLAAAWTAVLHGWAHAANAAQFQWSSGGAAWRMLARAELGGVSAFEALSAALAGLLCAVLVRAALMSRAYAVAGPRLVVYAVLALAALGTWRVSALAETDPAIAPDRPHVILIGVDSLRPDVVANGSAAAMTPHIDQFIADALRFDDAITPLARTFPSWLTILTGRHPVSLAARENLLPRSDLKLSPTLGDLLRQGGYQTVYATDEVRASNLDESYGFDEIIGPRIGALDYVLGTANDLPLSNLVANSWLGRLLFPYTYVNRAAAVTYQPQTFVEHVTARVEFDRPTLLALHLTLPHWPYRWADDNGGSLADAPWQPYLYSQSVMGADRQFGQLMAALERKGALSNAIVVVLSDHGEGIGLSQDSLVQESAGSRSGAGISIAGWGHGNSVLSPAQYHVLMAWRGYGRSMFARGSGRSAAPTSLEDVVPTVLDLLDVPRELEFDGLSLAAILRGDHEAAVALADRVRFTETGMSVGFKADGEPDVEDVVGRGLTAYAVNPANGRLELRASAVESLLRTKERAAIGRDRVLAAVPLRDGATGYVVVSRSGGVPHFLDTSPDPAVDPELRRMWDELLARFGDELGGLPES
jgi:arylsulfatase A-like enzyme